MKSLLPILLLLLLSLQNVSGQQNTCKEDSVALTTTAGVLKGTLLLPAKQKKPGIVALIIPGSGPTDRNGNGANSMKPYLQTNSYKLLAEALCAQGIASLRYDKRGIGASTVTIKDQAAHTFADMVADAAALAQMLKSDNRFSKLVIIGHSEGSLIGMLAAQQAATSGFISIAGPGEPAHETLRKQFQAQSPAIMPIVNPILDSLAAGERVKKVDPMLNTLFNPSLQPYLISWFKYSPQQEIAKLKFPVLIVQGTTDLQVKEEDAQKLAKAQPAAKLLIVPGMNHTLKDAPADIQQNIATYNKPELPLTTDFTAGVIDFIKGLK